MLCELELSLSDTFILHEENRVHYKQEKDMVKRKKEN